jgi:hypothetical protein
MTNRNKQFSFSEKINVSKADFEEFNLWVEGKLKVPKLKRRFDSDEEYEEYMLEYDGKFSEKTFSTSIPKKGRYNSKTKEYKALQNLEEDEFDSLQAAAVRKGLSLFYDHVKDEFVVEAGKKKAFSDALDEISITPSGGVTVGITDVMGTLIYAPSIVHLYHLLSKSYGEHKALEELYESLIETVDSLLEKMLSIVPSEERIGVAECVNTIQLNDNIVEYLTNLLDKIGSISIAYSPTQSLVDDIVNSIDSCMYKLLRLNSGKVTFSIKKSSSFSDDSVVDFLFEGKKGKDKWIFYDKNAKEISMKEALMILGVSKEQLDEFAGLVFDLEDRELGAGGYITTSMIKGAIKAHSVNVAEGEEVNKSFSEITSDEAFREYAHKIMKSAHGEDYSEEYTDEIVDELLKNNKGSDYGELIGRLTSGLGQ